ncbi:Transmembrane amino acid transporter protein [Ceratobasidium sp. AG-Ba]|nr:Transmembrane amino acid transporter protein [Ceratobasidium sp. AG-Ba]
MAHNQRQYATPIPTNGTPIMTYGTTMPQGTPIPRRLNAPGANAATPTSRASFTGRVRAASVNIRDFVGSYQQSQSQLYGSFLGSPSTRVNFPRRQRDEEESVLSDDGELTEEGEWEDDSGDEEHTEGEGEDDVDEEYDQTDVFISDPQRHLQRPPPPLSRSPGIPYGEYGSSPRSILREPGSVTSSPDERRLLLVTKMPSYSGSGGSETDSPRLHRTGGSVGSPGPRRLSISRRKSISKPPRGSSSFGQTLFNAIAILLGVGMLSEPLAFAYAGWIGGFLLITFYGFLTCYTAKILAKIILADGRLRTYADIGQKAFGPRSNVFTSALFCLELFSLSVVLVVLFSDSMHAVAPQFSSHEYKVLGLLILLPSIFLPLHLLSFASLLGILATVFIIVVIFVDGFSKTTSPGSLWESAPTDLAPNWAALPVSFGLFMAGFAGHAVIPSLARDMAEPEHFDSMINWAFFVATLIYALVGAGGYVMFGRDVSDEVSVDLMKIPEYNQTLNKIAVWMLVISPLTKFALCTRPLNITIEIMLGIDPAPLPLPSSDPPSSPSQNKQSHAEQPISSSHPLSLPTAAHEKRKGMLRAIERVALALAVVLVAILFPAFGAVMAFLGAFSAFMLCVIGPICAKAALAKRMGAVDGILLVIAIAMAAAGTWVAFVTGKGA